MKKEHSSGGTFKRAVIALGLLVLVSTMYAGHDWAELHSYPALTLAEIALEALLVLAGYLLIFIPVAVLYWNKIVSPTFHWRKITYVEALILAAIISCF